MNHKKIKQKVKEIKWEKAWTRLERDLKYLKLIK